MVSTSDRTRIFTVRREAIWLVVGLALLTRIALLPVACQHPERILHRDSPSYILLATNLLDGRGFSADSVSPFTPDAFRTPLSLCS